MRLLAFDTSTDTMSIAVGRILDGEMRVWQHSALGGARASRALIPAILDLMAQAGMGFADLDAIAFGRGPGAFTGLRTACSVAQGLGFGARRGVPGDRDIQVLPVDTLLALAEEARHQCAGAAGALRVLSLLDARMDEIYAASYAYDGVRWEQRQATSLGRPENLVLEPHWQQSGLIMAGNVFASYGGRLPVACGVPRIAALPTASAMLRLAPALLAAGHGLRAELALPVYIRDKVAQTSSERSAAKAALSLSP